MLFVLGQIQPGDADLLKTQLAAPFFDGLAKSREIEVSSSRTQRRSRLFGVLAKGDEIERGRVHKQETTLEMGIILPDIGACACDY
jgi:hypothetical protein